MREPYYNHNYFFPKILKNGILTAMIKDNTDTNARSTFITAHYNGTILSISKMVCQANKAKKIAKLSLLSAEYVNIKKLFTLLGNSEKRP